MFSGIRSRLIASYILVIFVALAITFVTLLLLSRPLQSRVVRNLLQGQVNQLVQSVNTLYRQHATPQEIIGRVSEQLPGDSRLLLVNPRGEVLADSAHDWNGQQLNVEPASDSAGQRLSRTGSLTGPDGAPFLYAVAPVGPPDQRAVLVSVAPRPRAFSAILGELSVGFVVAGLVAFVLSIFLGVFIARSVASPLRNIARAAEAMAGGHYDLRVPESGPDEVRRVARSFNLMIGRVKAGQQAMRDFVSNVSHDLKTPLTSIQGFSQALLEGQTPDEAARRRAARIIYDEAGRMVRMVEDLLDLARIDAGQIVMAKTPINLADLLAATVDKLAPQAAQRNITLRRAWNAVPVVAGDGDRLAQVFTNLIDNALKHTPAGGQVTVGSQVVKNLSKRQQRGITSASASTLLSRKANFVEISVADTGPGIPADELARVFERLYQVDKSRKRGRGTGLGLAIVREIVEAHSGYVRAESVEGVGTKFTVALPLTEADAVTRLTRR
ncbi:MAG: sensor histidine kinase [Anaerolineae bacterium]